MRFQTPNHHWIDIFITNDELYVGETTIAFYNESNWYHNTSGPAVISPGSRDYFLSGLQVSKEILEDPETIKEFEKL